MDKNLSFQDPNDLVDLAGYLKRALRLDSTGAVRLRAFGSVLAAYVSPIYAGSLLGDGLTVIGLRTINLTSQNELDSLFTIEALLASVEKSIESGELVWCFQKPLPESVGPEFLRPVKGGCVLAKSNKRKFLRGQKTELLPWPKRFRRVSGVLLLRV